MNDVDVAIAAALAGADAVRDRYGATLTHHAKGPLDFATEADLQSEAAILHTIRSNRPDDAFIGEEGGVSGDTTGRTWLVDPLCGTLNFAARTPLFCVNVALRGTGAEVVAASADPMTGEVFWSDGAQAMRRVGAQDHPLRTVAPVPLVEVETEGRAAWAARVCEHPDFRAHFAERSVSSTLPLLWLGDGRRAAYLIPGDMRDNVHFAAGIAICRAAGCVVTGLHGEPVESGAVGLLAAIDDQTHRRLLAIVSSVGEP